MAGLSLTACAMPALPPPAATLDNIQSLRAGNVGPMRVGTFTAAPGIPAQMDREVAVRAGVQPAPKGSFARYLADTLAAELSGAGKLEPGSTLVVSGVLSDTHVDSLVPTAHARLGARFALARGQTTVFDKTLSVQSVWDSNIIGAVAIPDALNHYIGLYPKLVAVLLADPDFRRASRGP